MLPIILSSLIILILHHFRFHLMKFMFLISILIPSILTIITAAFRLCVGHEVKEVGLETGNNAMIPPDPAAL
jgi:hypothetical protein